MSRPITPLEELLLAIEDQLPRGWVFLPRDSNWGPQCPATVLELEEVPPELELEPEAGIPLFARQNGLVCVLPVTAMQDVVANARAQKPDATSGDLLAAFEYYYQHDAFIALTGDTRSPDEGPS